MARARNIKPAFFKNEELADCPPFARLLFIGLWTLADRDGRLEYRPKRIKAELFPFDNLDLSELVMTLHGKKLLIVYEAGGSAYIAIPTFTKHQRPHPHEPSLSLPQPPEIPTTYEKAVTSNVKKLHDTANCASSLNAECCSLNPESPLLNDESGMPQGASAHTGVSPATNGMPNATEFFERYQKFAEAKGLSVPNVLNDERRAKINTRLKQPGWFEVFRKALAKLPLGGDWQPNIDWLIKNGTNAAKVAEGNYDRWGAAKKDPRGTFSAAEDYLEAMKPKPKEAGNVCQ